MNESDSCRAKGPHDSGRKINSHEKGERNDTERSRDNYRPSERDVCKGGLMVSLRVVMVILGVSAWVVWDTKS